MGKMVSVIVPAYNVAQHIEKCLYSLIAQTYADLELIVVNDGSVDNTRQMVETVMAEDSRIRLINQANGGSSAARNTGLRVAKGEYIGFVDSDDYVEKDYVEKLVAGLETEGCDLSMCGYVQETLSGVEKFRSEGWQGVMSAKAALMHMYVPQDRSWGSYTWNKLYRKSILDANQLNFSEEIIMFEDIHFVCHYLKCCQNVAYIHDALYHYVVNDVGLTRNVENTPRNIKKWSRYTDAYNYILPYEKDEEIYRMLNMQKMIHTATAVRVLYSMKQTKQSYYRKKRKFLAQNIGSFLVYKQIPMKKKIGAVLTLVSPALAFWLWNRNR